MIEKLRANLEKIDKEIRNLFIKRMEISKEIGKYKKDNKLPILDKKREDELLLKYKNELNDNILWPYYEIFLINLFALSKEYQK